MGVFLNLFITNKNGRTNINSSPINWIAEDIRNSLLENLSGLDAVLKSYNGSVANSDDEILIVMACDDSLRIDSFVKTMKKYNPIDIVRSGSVIMEM